MLTDILLDSIRLMLVTIRYCWLMLILSHYCWLVLIAIRSLRLVEISGGWCIYLRVYICSSGYAKIFRVPQQIRKNLKRQ